MPGPETPSAFEESPLQPEPVASKRPEPTDNADASPGKKVAAPKTPAVMPAEGIDSLTHAELGDIVKLKKPYMPVIGTDRQKGPFGFGIVAEILHVLPDGRTRNVSLYLYDPDRKEIFLGPNGIPEFVDWHCSEFTLYKRATEMGYSPTDPNSTPGP